MEMYDGDGRLLSQYHQHKPAERAIQRYHRKTGEAVLSDDLPVGIRQAIKLPLVWTQIVNRNPWKIMWIRTDSQGRRRRGQKLCPNLGAAIREWERIKVIVPNATIVSRARAYDIPPKLRGKLPPRWYWCPHCMKPRRFVKDPDPKNRHHVLKKVWSEEKKRYIWVERLVWRIECPMCGCSNRNPIFRRSNQPWEVRRFKKGVRRARKRPARKRRRS